MKRDLAIVLVLGLLLTAAGEAFLVTVDFYPTARADKGEDIEQAFKTLTYFAVPVFALVVAALVYWVLRRGSSEAPEEDGPPLQGRGTVPVAWFAITAGLALVIMVYPGLLGIPEVFDDEEPDLVVNVVGIQWAWLIDYPEYGVSAQDELVLPVDRTVRFEITSQDVLHSFWIPGFLMKIDAVPGRTTTMTLTPTETGDFQTDPNMRLQCAELCGIRHAKMRIPVRVVSEGEFEDWIEEREVAASTPGVEPPPGLAIGAILDDFTIELSQDSVSAGAMSFNITNEGAIVHNLQVVATDLEADSLPVDESTFTVDESQVELLASSADLTGGESGLLSVELDAGPYVLICGIPGHYQQGMYTSFTVE